MFRTAGDERGVVVEWLVKMFLGLALAGIIVFDLGAVVVNQITLDSTANDIAIELTTDLTASQPTTTDPVLLRRAEQLADDAGARLVRLRVDPAGVLHIKLAREARTIVLQRVEPIRKWGLAVVGGQAGTQ